jgi:hypothetical protein
MGEGSGDDSIPYDMGNAEDAWVPNDDDSEDMSQLMEDSKIPLYDGCRTNWLVATVLLLNCFIVFGVSIAFANEMLKLIKELLPPGNSPPKSHYKARKYMAKMGLCYNSIHACKNGCCLFWKDLKDVDKCPNCNKSRYTANSTTRPVKVLRHFPLIPRLKRMFRCKRLAELSKWHATQIKEGNHVECVPDSKAWNHINSMYPDFGSKTRNIRLGMALDGVNPFSNQSLSHSTWPVVLLNCNLPHRLVTKGFFIILALLIPGKESVTSENLDTYLAPLVEELLELWEGVRAVDVSSQGSDRNFSLRAILIWCIHDYPVYGLISGQVTKGWIQGMFRMWSKYEYQTLNIVGKKHVPWTPSILTKKPSLL